MTAAARRPVPVLELYCGIGGCAAALAGMAAEGGRAHEVVAAIDVDRRALAVHQRSFGHPTLARTLEGLSADELAAFGADLWWLSPPCQPFTRRGLRKDDRDPRSRSLLALLDQLERIDEMGGGGRAPDHLALENVPGFQGSRTHARLVGVLERRGYAYREGTLCPTELGLPNRRLRYYLAASREGELGDFRVAEPVAWTGTLRGFLGDGIDRTLDHEWDPRLRVDPALAERYRHALDVVGPDEPGRPTACFTAAYGRSPVRSGSYLALGDGALRRFSPQEVLTLLGFPGSHTLPDDLPPEKAWPLAGNSLSVPAVRRVLATLPPFIRTDRAP
jgi:site-specific DNA-cytosine methylase